MACARCQARRSGSALRIGRASQCPGARPAVPAPTRPGTPPTAPADVGTPPAPLRSSATRHLRRVERDSPGPDPQPRCAARHTSAGSPAGLPRRRHQHQPLGGGQARNPPAAAGNYPRSAPAAALAPGNPGTPGKPDPPRPAPLRLSRPAASSQQRQRIAPRLGHDTVPHPLIQRPADHRAEQLPRIPLTQTPEPPAPAGRGTPRPPHAWRTPARPASASSPPRHKCQRLRRGPGPATARHRPRTTAAAAPPPLTAG